MNEKKPRIIRNAVIPPRSRMGRPRKYLFGDLRVGDAIDCPASYYVIYCSVARFKKKNPDTQFQINVLRRGDNPMVRVTRTK